MIIKEIDIYGFGKWTNERFTLDPSIQLVFGENEAGKSTLMAFIQAVLFGFPKKNEQKKSYEPLHHSIYGGSLVIKTEHDDQVIIERVRKNRMKGEVTVKYSTGKTGGEEELDVILNGISQTVFEGIFSFDLSGLQGLEKMNREEMNSFLYDTSISGGPSLLQSEKEADEQMQAWFKSRGKKTPINLTLKELQEKEKEVLEWRAKLAEYDDLANKIDSTKQRIDEVATDKHTLKQTLSEYDRVKKMLPLYGEYKVIEATLPNEKELSFPESGIERLERSINEEKELQINYTEKEEQKVLLEEKVKSLRNQLSPLDVKEIERQVKKLNNEEGRYRELTKSKTSVLQKKDLLEKKQKVIEMEWGIEDQQHLKKRDITRQANDKLRELRKVYEESDEALTRLEDQQGQLKKEQERLLLEFEQTEQGLLSESEKAQAEQTLDMYHQLEAFKPQLTMLKHRLNVLESKKESEKDSYATPLTFGAIVLILIGGWSLFTGAILQGIFTLGIALLALFFIKVRPKGDWNRGSGEIDQVSSEIRKWDEIEKQLNQQPVSNWKEKLTLHERAVREAEQINRELGQRKRSALNVSQDISSYQQKVNEALGELQRWAKSTGFEPGYTAEQYEDMFTATTEWKQLDEERQRCKKELIELDHQINRFLDSVNNVATYVGLSKEQPPSLILSELERWVENEKDLISICEKAVNDLETLTQELRSINRRMAKEKAVVSSLFDEAGVTDEESFRKKEMEWREDKKKRTDARTLLAQMKAISSKDTWEKDWERCEEWKDTIDDHIENFLSRIHAYEREEKQLIEQRTNFKHVLRELENGTTYEDLLQQFEVLKQELNTYSKEWSMLALAKEIIQRTKRRYEEKRQPAVLQGAEQYFKTLTDGRYVKLFAPLGETRFVVERNDGARFGPADLSQGTCELLYVAIRFSLVEHYKQEEPLPIIIDEAFVNFDALRRDRVIKAINRLGKTHQILYFTCHKNVQEEMNREPLILNEQVLLR
ncbi:ATP-binding protein [Alteribacter aurantiacus]|uniref:ATP-binding protein n=1 Tax=Alteribacter aurantiacus TaxID=254410 RepID=UPI0004047B0E|nr:AAA family ATPase [Alteribacter aurantiacus]